MVYRFEREIPKNNPVFACGVKGSPEGGYTLFGPTLGYYKRDGITPLFIYRGEDEHYTAVTAWGFCYADCPEDAEYECKLQGRITLKLERSKQERREPNIKSLENIVDRLAVSKG